MKKGWLTGFSMVILIFIFLCIVCILGWWFMPAYFLKSVDPMEVKEIRVRNGINEDEFVITEPDDIAFIVNSIKEISFHKYGIHYEVEYWYCLSFISKNGEEIVSLRIQNPRFVRNNISQECAAFYNCDGELGEVTDYLKSIESTLFPDYDKDPDFSPTFINPPPD